MKVAFTNAALRGSKRQFKTKSGGVIKPGVRPNICHIPEGTGFTLCGARVAQTIEVEDNAELIACGTCKSRLAAIERKKPGSANRFLVGNPQLPAPII